MSVNLRKLLGTTSPRITTLNANGIVSIRDLLQYFPRTYEDRSSFSLLENLSKGVEYDKNAEKYIWESENESLKDFEAGRRIGEKDGESRGKSKGRFQGFMISTLTAITLLGIKIFGERKQKF